MQNPNHKNVVFQKIMDKNRHLYTADFVHLQIALCKNILVPDQAWL